MNAAVRCIILLVCITVCTSTAIMGCRCLKTIKAVRRHLIADVKEYGPRPYCKKREIIVSLTDSSSHCLDPDYKFSQKILQSKQMHMAAKVTKINITGKENPTATFPAPARVPGFRSQGQSQRQPQ